MIPAIFDWVVGSNLFGAGLTRHIFEPTASCGAPGNSTADTRPAATRNHVGQATCRLEIENIK
ncbi:MAG: hypothetical protein DRP47_08185 [Candidatus Zixiibacteriota bacterium]|nr:MAG: hypothetical protein DRP47_08185 [candidate division Zixibacteria bacterium]